MFAHNKDPSLRKEQLRQAGRLRIPFTTGMLIGIGESHEDRLQTLSDIAAIAREYQHIQEVILQPYSPASDKMARTHVTAKATTTTTTTTTTNCSNTGTSTTDDSINDNNINNNRWFDVSELPQLVLLARDILPANVVIQIPPNLILSRGSDISSRSGDISSRSVDSSSDNSSDISSESSGDDSGSSAGLNLLHQCLLAGVLTPSKNPSNHNIYYHMYTFNYIDTPSHVHCTLSHTRSHVYPLIHNTLLLPQERGT